MEENGASSSLGGAEIHSPIDLHVLTVSAVIFIIHSWELACSYFRKLSFLFCSLNKKMTSPTQSRYSLTKISILVLAEILTFLNEHSFW